MLVLPPGTLLQLMYLKERIAQIPIGEFIEVGPGSGEITNLLLNAGWVGRCYDLDGTTTQRLTHRFNHAVRDSRLQIIKDNFISTGHLLPKVDLVISCMVMEHLDDAEQSMFLNQARDCLKPNGRMIGLVPASERYWGIDDEIAGHFRRYTRAALQSLFI